MKTSKIGIIYGMESTFPDALINAINNRQVSNVVAEHMQIGALRMDAVSDYKVIVDRVSLDIDFYRSYLKTTALDGTILINDPFVWSADDKFFNYALATKLGIMAPKTVILPHKSHPVGTTVQSMRNLVFPLDWDHVFEYVGFPAFLKPYNGRGWRDIYQVHSPEEFFRAYDQTGSQCMTLQEEIQHEEFFRCYVVGQKKVRLMKYDARQPYHLRYSNGTIRTDPAVLKRMEQEAALLCQALHYDFNTVEFAVRDGVPYAIDFLEPVPEADVHSLGEENFQWVVNEVADMAIARALRTEQLASQYRWSKSLRDKPRARAAKA